MAEIKYENDKTVGKKIKVSCQSCGPAKNHVVLRSVDETGSDEINEEYDFSWHIGFQIIQCQGCDTISFRSISWDSEQFNYEDEPSETEELYPNRTSGRPEISDSHLLPNDLEKIYSETVSALNSGQPILAGIGIRAVIEAIIKEKNATGKDLFSKINSLVTAQVLTKEGAEILHKLRILGNKAAHEVMAHSAKELGLALDVVEHLLQAVYILPFHAKRTFK